VVLELKGFPDGGGLSLEIVLRKRPYLVLACLASTKHSKLPCIVILCFDESILCSICSPLSVVILTFHLLPLCHHCYCVCHRLGQ
jgi:hypothetical protein